MRFSFKSSLANLVSIYAKLESRGLSCPLVKATKDKVLQTKTFYTGDILSINGHDALDPGLRHFFYESGSIAVVPIDDPVCIRGFIFSSLRSKSYRLVKDNNPLLYGFDRFQGFTFGKTVFIGEGIKECEAIKLFYPFALSVLGSHITSDQQLILDNLTNRVVFVGDGDFWGRGLLRLNRRKAKIAVSPPFKDLGLIFDEDGNHRILVESYIKSLVSLYAN